MSDILRMLFGMVLLLALVGITAVIIMGHVEEKDSMALMPIVTALATLSGSFATWAFSPRLPIEAAKADLKAPPGENNNK